MEEAPLQSDEHRCLTHSSSFSSSSRLHRCFFPLLLLASSPLFISALRVPSSRLQLLLLQPIHRACCISSSTSPGLQRLLYPTSNRPSPGMETQSWPFSAAERESEPSSSCSLSYWEDKHKRREEGIFCTFWRLKNPSSASIFSIGLQFWLCVGTRKRGPKCLKPITCCQSLGVTLRCVALIYVACRDNALISFYLSVLCCCCIKGQEIQHFDNIYLWSFSGDCASLIAPKDISIMVKGVWQNDVLWLRLHLEPSAELCVCLYMC